MANKRPIIIEDDMAVGYPMEGNLVPITRKNLMSLGVNENNATMVMELYKKLGDEAFATEVNGGCNPFLNRVIDEIINNDFPGFPEPEIFHVAEDAQNVSNDKLALDKTYLDFSNATKNMWNIIQSLCPDAFHAQWTQYEG